MTTTNHNHQKHHHNHSSNQNEDLEKGTAAKDYHADSVALRPLISPGKKSHHHHDGCCEDDEALIPSSVASQILEQPPVNPDDLDLFQAAQHGFLNRVSTLIESGVPADSRDKGNSTALHWACINNRIAIAKYLLEKGVFVDVVGGELLATPLHWAASRGQTQVISFLLKHNANPALCDSQGYNALHLAAQNGHAITVAFLIMIGGMDVDGPDSQGRTALMWAGYKGSSTDTMEALVRSGANLELKDATGLTALHWTVISQHMPQADVLIRAGASVDVKDPNGKSPEDWAKEAGSIHPTFERMIRGHLARTTQLPFTRVWTIRLIYAMPYIYFAFALYIMCNFLWYISLLALPVGLFLVAVQTIFRYFLARRPNEMIRSPFFTGIMQATGVYALVWWFTDILPNAGGLLWFENFVFALLAVCVLSSFYGSIMNDPGYLDKHVGRRSVEEKKQVMQRLADYGILDEHRFCFLCMAPAPLRSKHCKICERCVARFDHHCPWTYNCVGVGTQRAFVLFTFFLPVSSWYLAYITYLYFQKLTPHQIQPHESCIFSQSFCRALAFNPSLVIVSVCSVLFAFWGIYLTAYQCWVIGWKGMSTHEMLKPHKYPVHVRIVGERGNKRWAVSKFDRGVVRNCVGFWKLGGGEEEAEDYWYTLYNVPNEL